jgi:oligosaccharyltransferase complex subunit alpha (ribophorin I)
MKFPTFTVLLGLVFNCNLVCAGQSNNSTSDARLVLPRDFIPPQTFKNVNLVRTTSLEKGYVRETVNVVVENTAKQPQSDYYMPFPSDTIGKIGAFEVRDKKTLSKPRFDIIVTQSISSRCVSTDS